MSSRQSKSSSPVVGEVIDSVRGIYCLWLSVVYQDGTAWPAVWLSEV